VAPRLLEAGAYARDGKIYDSIGREIIFLCFASAGNGETPHPSYTTTRQESHLQARDHPDMVHGDLGQQAPEAEPGVDRATALPEVPSMTMTRSGGQPGALA